MRKRIQTVFVDFLYFFYLFFQNTAIQKTVEIELTILNDISVYSALILKLITLSILTEDKLPVVNKFKLSCYYLLA